MKYDNCTAAHNGALVAVRAWCHAWA
ncbi:hypothetical protein [Mycolicibacterium sp. YH-1]